jgi:hypothetical protein
MFGFEIKAQAEVVEVDADEKHLQTIFDILNFAEEKQGLKRIPYVLGSVGGKTK